LQHFLEELWTTSTTSVTAIILFDSLGGSFVFDVHIWHTLPKTGRQLVARCVRLVTMTDTVCALCLRPCYTFSENKGIIKADVNEG